MADNQSKNLPKADRQALNEVGRPSLSFTHAPIHFRGPLHPFQPPPTHPGPACPAPIFAAAWDSVRARCVPLSKHCPLLADFGTPSLKWSLPSKDGLLTLGLSSCLCRCLCTTLPM